MGSVFQGLDILVFIGISSIAMQVQYLANFPLMQVSQY